MTKAKQLELRVGDKVNTGRHPFANTLTVRGHTINLFNTFPGEGPIVEILEVEESHTKVRYLESRSYEIGHPNTGRSIGQEEILP
jgi:hypothetical protein